MIALEEGGFYVISNKNGKLILEHDKKPIVETPEFPDPEEPDDTDEE